MRQGETDFSTIAAIDILDYYVRIRFSVQDYDLPTVLAPYDWYGIIRHVSDQVHGVQNGVRTGVQTFTAYAIESLLDRDIILTSVADQRYSRGIIHNEDGRPNMDPHNQIFCNRRSQTTDYWSTRAIVNYLLRYLQPRDYDGTAVIPFVISAAMLERLPDWDQPVVETHGKTLYGVLNTLISRQRGLGWRTRVDVDENVQLEPYSWLPSDLVVEAPDLLKGNFDQYDINCIADSRFQTLIRSDSSGTVDQVVVQGRRRRSVFTVSNNDMTLDRGWASGLQIEYNLAASGDADYPAAGEIDLRRKRNDEARRADRLKDVYCRYQLPSVDGNWDCFAGDGAGGSQTPVAPEEDDTAVAHPIYQPDIAVLRTIPLLAGYDYSGSRIQTDTVLSIGLNDGIEESPVLGITPIPDELTRWVQLEHVGDIGQREQIDAEEDSIRKWRGMVRATGQEAAFRIYISGMPQHTISPEFTPLPDDEDVGEWTWQTMVFTVAIDEDRSAEAMYPLDGDLILTRTDIRRVMFVSAGKSYTRDYVAPGTVVGVDGESGELLRSTTGGTINDTRDKLRRIARLAYIWYGHNRVICELTTSRLTDALGIGDLVRYVHTTGVQEDAYLVNGPVTEVTIEWALGAEDVPPMPRISYITGYANLDPLRL